MKKAFVLARFSAALLVLAAALTGRCLGEGAHLIDENKILQSLRKHISLPPNVQVKLTEITPSPFAGFYSGFFEMNMGDKSRRENILISTDSRYCFMGALYDVTLDADSLRRNSVDLSRSPYKGDINAPVVLVEYSDFQCVPCRNVYETFEKEKFLEGYEKKLRVVYKNFPISKSHTWAVRASVAALCADRQNMKSFWKMCDQIFANQNQINEENLKEKMMKFAGAAGLDMKQFEDCFDKQMTLDKVNADMNEGSSVGIYSTPSFMINGRVVMGFRGTAELKQVIDEFLSKK